MVDFSEVIIQDMVIHLVGNKLREEEIKISNEVCRELEETTLEHIKQCFFSTLTFDLTYQFTHESDVLLNEVYHYTSQIFRDRSTFYEQSVHIANHLYEISVHPNIKSGELYIIYLSNCFVDDAYVDAIGIFKSEVKDVYFEINEDGSAFDIDCKQGISTKKIDKGCLLVKDKEDIFPKVYVGEKNMGDAQYWKKNFLNIQVVSDEFTNTSAVLKTCKQYVKKTVEAEPKEKLVLLKNSVEYFDSHEEFQLDEFVDSVFVEEEDAGKFKTYLEESPKRKVKETFAISSKAVSQEKKKMKNLIKLDESIEIKIKGNVKEVEKLIETGFDKEKNMGYYKIYFDDVQFMN